MRTARIELAPLDYESNILPNKLYLINIHLGEVGLEPTTLDYEPNKFPLTIFPQLIKKILNNK